MVNNQTIKKVEPDFVLFMQNLTKTDVKITPETMLFDTGLIDSLTILDLIAYVESYFSIKIADEDITLDNFRTIHHMVSTFSDYEPK